MNNIAEAAITDGSAKLFIEVATRPTFWKIMDMDSMLFTVISSKMSPVISQTNAMDDRRPLDFSVDKF